MRIARRLVPHEKWESIEEPALQGYFSQLAIAPISGGVQRAYAKIMAIQDDAHSVLTPQQGWVAATAYVQGATIITHSTDFAKCGLVTAEAIDRVPFFA
jgi:predicted nucleic acid-binding protein